MNRLKLIAPVLCVIFQLPFFANAQVVTSMMLNQQVNDLAYDSVLSKIIITIPSTDPINANSIGYIDPITGSLTNTIYVGDEPNPLALTDNGQFLYFGSDSTGTIRKLDLFNQTIVQTIQMPYLPVCGQAYANNIASQPGNDSVIVVTGKCTGSTGRPSVRVYSNGIKLNDTINSLYYIDAIQFNSSSVLYGYNNHTTSREFTKSNVDQNGISVINSLQNAFSNIAGNQFPEEFTICIDRALSDFGYTVHVFSAVPSIGGTIQLSPNAGTQTKRACFDKQLDLMCVARWAYTFPTLDSIFIERFNRGNYAPVDIIKVPTAGGQIKKIINWGGPGKYALCTTNGKLVIVNSLPASVDQPSENSEYTLFPTIGNGLFQLKAFSSNNPAADRIEIYDGTGRLVTSQKVEESSFDIDITDKANGVYFIKLHTESKSLFYKIIKI